MIFVPKIRQVNIRQDGDHVLLLEKGIAVLSMPWDVALDLSRAIKAKAKLAEEWAKANEIVMDQAFLMRAGIPIGLSARRDIMKEAVKEASWDTGLRKAIPSIKSAAKFGKPMIIRHHPPKGKRNGK
jgi:hypothetical protein